MNNILLLLSLSFFTFTACSNTPKAPEEKENMNVDTIAATNEEVAKPALPKSAYANPGIWSARIAPAKKGKGNKILVFGTLNVENPKRLVRLSKDTSPSTIKVLTLNLSAEPVQNKEKPVSVKYEELIQTPDLYERVNIVHGGKIVYIITHIGH